MLELRERAEATGMTSSTSEISSLGTFQAAAKFVRQTINEDFGEPLYPVSANIGHSLDESETQGDDENTFELRQMCEAMDSEPIDA
jgi:hypothetical protein